MKSILRFAVLVLAASAGNYAATTRGISFALQVGSIPADMRCLRLTAIGTRTVTRIQDVTPGQSAAFDISGLPVGAVAFNAEGFDIACTALRNDSVPGWTGAVTSVAVD